MSTPTPNEKEIHKEQFMRHRLTSCSLNPFPFLMDYLSQLLAIGWSHVSEFWPKKRGWRQYTPFPGLVRKDLSCLILYALFHNDPGNSVMKMVEPHREGIWVLGDLRELPASWELKLCFSDLWLHSKPLPNLVD